MFSMRKVRYNHAICQMCSLSFAARMIFLVFCILLISGDCFGQWRTPEAVLCYQIEQDFNKARLPDIPIYKVSPEYKSSTRSFHVAPQEGKNIYKYVNGVHYTYFLAIHNAGKVEYKMSGKYDRFVTAAGFDDRADNSASAKIEVYADEDKIFSSDRINKFSRPVEINVKIPVECRVLKIAVVDKRGSGHMVFGNAGFTSRAYAPLTGECELYVPDEYGDNFDVSVFSPSGQQVPSRVCSGYPHRPLKIQFDTSAGGLGSYFAYIKPVKEQQGKLDKLWYGKSGLTLETRILAKDKERCDQLPGFVEAWKNDSWIVDSSFTDGVFHSWPIEGLDYGHELYGDRRSCYGQYYYIGYFKVEEAGEYSFATCSRWPSTIFVDDKFVVHWLGKHDFHGGRRCEYSGTVNLTPGVHKIEYMNFNRWGELYAMCAWRKGSDVYRIMSGCDFVPGAYYKPVKVFAKDAASRKNTFAWKMKDDVRVGVDDSAVVAVEFKAIEAKNLKDPSYRWEFDDGIIGVGDTVEHVFIRKGLHKVKLIVSDSGEKVCETQQTINVDVCRDKLFVEARDERLFNNIISKLYLQHVRIGDLIYFYKFADRYGADSWKLLASEVICGKKDNELEFGKHLGFYYEFINYLVSVETGRYDLAIDFSGRLLAAVKDTGDIVTDIRLDYIRQLLDYTGDSQEGQKQLGELGGGLDFSRQKEREVVDAELKLAIAGRTELNFSEPLGTASELERLKIRIAGDLRFAEQCAASDDLNFVQQGFDRLDGILKDSPSYVVDSEFNLVRLKLWQRAEGWPQVYHIAKRCERMEMSDIYEPELLGFQVLALVKSGKAELARKIFDQLKEQWPYSPETAKAEELLQ